MCLVKELWHYSTAVMRDIPIGSSIHFFVLAIVPRAKAQ